MKKTDAIILFICIMLGYVFYLDVRTNAYEITTVKHSKYNSVLDTAVYDTLVGMVESDDGMQNVINKDSVALNFFDSLSAGLNITNDNAKRSALKAYVPVLAVVEPDGISILHNSIVLDSGVSSIKQLWTEKIRFTYKKDNATIFFQTNNNIQIVIEGTNTIYTGDMYGLASKYSHDTVFMNWLSTSDLKDISTNSKYINELRLSTITNKVNSLMTYYVNEHNYIADSYGIKYTFYFPQSALDIFNNTIDEPSLFVLFQGYPLGSGSKDTYNKVAFGGSKTVKKDGYVVNQDATDSLFYYHKVSCSLVTHKDELYDNPSEAALSGAYPCEVCKP